MSEQQLTGRALELACATALGRPSFCVQSATEIPAMVEWLSANCWWMVQRKGNKLIGIAHAPSRPGLSASGGTIQDVLAQLVAAVAAVSASKATP